MDRMRAILKDKRSDLERLLPESERPSVLYLDDEAHNTKSFKALWRRAFNVYTSNDPDEAIKILGNEKIDVAIIDMRMPKMNGINFIKMAKEKYPNIRTIIYTANSHLVDNNEAKRLNTYVVSKPIADYQMFSLLRGNYSLISL